MIPQIIQNLTKFRRQLHAYPEIGFQQTQTCQRIINKLKQFGVPESAIHKIQPTAIVVTLQGQAEEQQDKPKKCIALRADIDALPMKQLNEQILHKSKYEGKAHMCGHDGHTACLVGFVPLFLKQLSRIPKNRSIKLFFQHSEQGPESGAKDMIQKGCLEGVDQIYGYHNFPVLPFGQIWVKQGIVFAQVTQVVAQITGTGGHGSMPDDVKQSTYAGVRFYNQAYNCINALKKQYPKEVQCTLPIFKAGQSRAVISQTCTIEGTIRGMRPNLIEKVMKKFEQIGQGLRKEGFKFQLGTHRNYPATVNHKKAVQNVERVGRRLYGDENVSHGILPVRASEDFSYFLQKIPGAYFVFTTGQTGKDPVNHNAKFDFNDKAIQKIALFWYHFAMDMLQVQIQQLDKVTNSKN